MNYNWCHNSNGYNLIINLYIQTLIPNVRSSRIKTQAFDTHFTLVKGTCNYKKIPYMNTQNINSFVP